MVPNDDSTDPGECFLSFSLGPVQTFIASARSLRDLWTGSKLLSWLIHHAMQPVLERFGAEAVVTPAGADERFREDSSLPHRFLAVVPREFAGGNARELALECENQCRGAWKRVCDAVRQVLDAEARARDPDWDRLWDAQVDGFFEVRVAVLPFDECDELVVFALLDKPFAADRPGALWWGRLELAARLMEAVRSEGQHPGYRAPGDVPQKCTLLGTYEQMGPAELKQSTKFWEALARRDWNGGTQIRKAERFCAVSLVKRFARAAFLDEELGLTAGAGYYPDTATIAAARWLREGEGPSVIEPKRERLQGVPWSGQWLHWPRREGPRRRNDEEQADDDPPPPRELWARIQEKRKSQEPPAYLAILMLDGDGLGRWLRGERTQRDGRALNRAISTTLAHFAREIAPEVVTRHEGALIYAGGDDVLAFLPARAALACARELNERYVANWLGGIGLADDESGGTLSAGLVVVHYKEDLRFALEQARRAEKRAKGAGRDALTLAICRRSGEHSSVVMPWPLLERLDGWVESFVAGASDRWLYALRAELPALQGADLPFEAVKAEVRRLADRAEDKSERIDPEDAVQLLNSVQDAETARKAKRTDSSVLGDFVTLGQSASFLARGRD